MQKNPLNETYPLTDSQDPLNGEYRQVLHWTIKDKPARIILLQILSIPVFIVSGLVFMFLAINIGGLTNRFAFSFQEMGISILSAVAGIAITILLHELVHGVTMRLYGAHPQYGVLWKQFMFYATSSGYGFRRNSFILVALAPLIVLSGLAVLGMVFLQGTSWVALLALCATMNAAGALGDLWIVSIALRYPPTATIVDERDGIRVLMRNK